MARKSKYIIKEQVGKGYKGCRKTIHRKGYVRSS